MKLKTSFRPIFHISNLFGLTFFSSSKLIYIHRIVIISILIAIVVLQIPVMSYWTDSDSGDLEAFLQFSKISIAWINYFLNYIATVYNNKKILNVFENLMNLKIEVDEKRFKALFFGQIWHTSGNFIIVVCFQFLAVHLTDEKIKYPFSAPMYIFLDTMHVFIIIQFVESVLLMREYFTALNNKILSMKNNFHLSSHFMKSRNLEEIISFKVSYSKLCKLCKQLNRAYEIQLLLTLIKCFVEVTTWLAGLLELKEKDYELNFLLSLTVAGFNLFVIFQICFFCYLTVSENNKSNVIIFNIINDVTDEDIKDELRIFSIQTLHERLSFTVLEFFKLDLTLVREMVAAVTSYLAIIYSFDRTRSKTRS